jgi:hypothetical protein
VASRVYKADTGSELFDCRISVGQKPELSFGE